MKLAATVLALIVAAHASAAVRARYLMGTLCEVSAADERQIEKAFAEAARVEAMLSTWRDDSELARYNANRCGAGNPAGEELASLLDVVEAWRIKTGGAFEPHIRPLIDAWKTREEGALPDAATIANALDRIHSGNAPIEEGAFGKGYALDRMLAVILSRGDGEGSVASGAAHELTDPSLRFAAPPLRQLRMTDNVVLNFGGQLLVRGSHEVTIADPEHRDTPLIRLTLRDASLSTSSGSEKQFVVNGRVFTHIIDPRTGEALPPRGSVSVIASSALLADIDSTALYVMGAGDGLRWSDANGIAALFIAPDGTAHPSRAFPKFTFVKD
jgi:FAD:protein FMN transferase